MAAIYVYPLEPAWRDRLGLPEPLRRPAPAIGEGLEGDAWAAHEFGGALLGDRRLSQRLVDSVLIQSPMPSAAACHSSRRVSMNIGAISGTTEVSRAGPSVRANFWSDRG
ncbi:MAG TPA: transposase DNA-binding-containing protein [Candidatus Accumulibacter phosphatis]|nr:transposase DNA-binding-containing protein [Candidatus Accumulibacter phosphatis]